MYVYIDIAGDRNIIILLLFSSPTPIPIESKPIEKAGAGYSTNY
jgi:hypothetical protein